MYQRQRKTRFPCHRCGLGGSRCICAQIPRLDLQTRIVLVIHAKELKRTTNTGSLALHALGNSAMRVRGEPHVALDLGELLDTSYETVLFYPTADAVELNREFVAQLTKPLQLIVPDGNWRQASKVHSRHKEIAHLPRVMMTSPNLARQHLRAETSPHGMSTLEAIARALEVIEGPEVGSAMMRLYRAKLHATLEGRGQIVEDTHAVIDRGDLFPHSAGADRSDIVRGALL